MTFSVGVLGLGKIGALYDLNTRHCMTHIKAAYSDPRFSLKFGYDISSANSNAIQSRYDSINLYHSLETVVNEDLKVDVLVVATPSNCHLTTIRDFIELCEPKIILCEKPLAETSSEAREIKDLCDTYDVKLFVNYMRRSIPEFRQIKKSLGMMERNSCCDVIISYSGSLIHNGSHFLDLMSYFFIDDFDVVLKTAVLEESPFVYVKNGKANIYLIPNSNPNVTNHEITITTNEKKFHVTRAGRCVTSYIKVEDIDFVGVEEYALDEEYESTYLEFMRHVYEDIYATLTGKRSTLCSGGASILLLDLIEGILHD